MTPVNKSPENQSFITNKIILNNDNVSFIMNRQPLGDDLSFFLKLGFFFH